MTGATLKKRGGPLLALLFLTRQSLANWLIGLGLALVIGGALFLVLREGAARRKRDIERRQRLEERLEKLEDDQLWLQEQLLRHLEEHRRRDGAMTGRWTGTPQIADVSAPPVSNPQLAAAPPVWVLAGTNVLSQAAYEQWPDKTPQVLFFRFAPPKGNLPPDQCGH